MNAAIIVGSMPAVYSYFKGRRPSASWLTSMNSLVLRFMRAASGGKIVFLHKQTAGVSSSLVTPSRHAVENGYLEIHDTHPLGDYELGSVRTENRGEGVASEILEEGITYNNISVHCWMNQE